MENTIEAREHASSLADTSRSRGQFSEIYEEKSGVCGGCQKDDLGDGDGDWDWGGGGGRK
jgi:hypothetical protein